MCKKNIFDRVIPFADAVIRDVRLGFRLSPGPEVIKLFFVLDFTEHEILNAHKYKNIKKFSFLQAQMSQECYFSCS